MESTFALLPSGISQLLQGEVQGFFFAGVCDPGRKYDVQLCQAGGNSEGASRVFYFQKINGGHKMGVRAKLR